MSLRNTIGSADLEAKDFAFAQNTIAGLCADAEYFTHLLNAHHIGIVFYLRKMAIDGYIIQVDYTEQKKLAAAVNKIGANINNICRRMNSTGRFYQDDVAELKGKLDGVWQLLRSKQSEEL